MFPNIILIGYNYNGVQLYINTHAFQIISNKKIILEESMLQ